MVNQCLYGNAQQRQPGLDHVPGLSRGALRRTLLAHGTDAQKKTYLPKLVSGGSGPAPSLLKPSPLRHRPGPAACQGRTQADGTYKITGNKIFISAGEHDVARQHHPPGAGPPAQNAGTARSTFVVPKFHVNADGSLGAQPHLLHGPGAQDGHPRQRHAQIAIDGAVGTW